MKWKRILSIWSN